MADSKFQPSAKRKSPGHVVRAADWVATPARGMAAFSYAPFPASGKSAAPAAVAEEARVAVLQAQLLRSEEQAKKNHEVESRARAEAEKQSFARGVEQGRKEGEAAARARFDQAVEILQAEVDGLFKALSHEKAAAFLEFESQVVGVLAFSLRRVFGELAGNFSEAVLPLIREAVQSLGQSASLLVKVHPSDLPLAEERRDFWQRLDASGDGVRCIADERVARGGCLVIADSTAARIDLESLGARMAEAVEAACADRKRAHPSASLAAEAIQA